jgi:hypothetical protein
VGLPTLFPRLFLRDCNVTSGTPWRVTDVMFRFRALVVMIRLNRGTEIVEWSSVDKRGEQWIDE